MRGNILAETNLRKQLVHDIKSANAKSDYNLIIFQTGYWHINSLLGRNDKALCEFLKVFKIFLCMQLFCT